mmetsp:Transcript_8983/g.22276  ORF Transcript_8983/g.22276 Transcript_8983/m.22276 type:complete len:294 (-) Transcript_8983:902-1783(-)
MERQPGCTSPTSYQHDQIEASVAPPSVKTRTWLPRSRRSSVGTHSGQKSPESITRRSGSAAKRASAAPSARRLSRSATITGGAVFHTVTCSASSSASHASGSGAPGAGSTRRPPLASTPKRSNTERSKESDARPSTASPAPTPQRPLRSRHVLLAPRCAIATPLGSPVEPEVKMMYASCSSGGSAAAACSGAVFGRRTSSSRRSGVQPSGKRSSSSGGGSCGGTSATVHSTARRILSTRPGGWPSEIGTYARPAASVASTATTCAQPLSSSTGTGAPLRPPPPPSASTMRAAQ